ncbi:hypothetical protein CAter282_2132 [Collimonas arenae]|uniref:Uncharacterized protein n=1 Tax=Collimonas arenae TaxID=279058 RepID=A0A127PQE4_9BURK|nr:hypothetical protein CAter10_2323 [Collimonas arenae]AMP09888.1 hypothetical protein CAter282_2132 [Collimonas arenae]
MGIFFSVMLFVPGSSYAELKSIRGFDWSVLMACRPPF